MITRFADGYDYTVHLAACAVRGLVPAEKPDGLSFSAVYRGAVRHDLAGLTYLSVERLKNKPDAALLGKWSDRRGLALARDLRQEAAADEIRAALGGAGIAYYELQGTRLKKLYPSPDMRTMSDIDFLIGPASLASASAALEKLGWATHAEEDGMTAVGLKEGGLTAELHGRYFASDPAYETAMDGLDPSGEKALYLFTLLHAVKHYCSGGCGVRRLIDLYLLQKAYPSFAADADITERLGTAGEAGLAERLLRIASYWFGDGRHSADTAEIEERIKRSGVHGTVEGMTENMLAAAGTGKTRYILRRAFPDAETLSRTYPALKGCPARYPYYCIRRLIAKRRRGAAELAAVRKAKKRPDHKPY